MPYTFDDFEKVYQPSESENIVTVKRIDSEFEIEQPIFTRNADDNALMIHFLSLDNEFYSYQTDSKNSPNKLFFRKRIVEPKGSMKYYQPKGSEVVPFFPKLVVDAFHQQETIKTLYITEGEKKAFALTKFGIHAVGITGIHAIKRDKETRRFHEDLERLIITCKVQKIVYLLDADIFDIDFEKGKELSKRPYSFYNAICTFRHCCEPLYQNPDVALKKVFVNYVNAEKTKEKGIDDLLFSLDEKTRTDFIDNFDKTSYSNKFLLWKDISLANFQDFKKLFGLQSANAFYEKYLRFIGLEEFNFRNKLFVWDGETLQLVKHTDALHYMRVGDTYFRQVEIPNKYKDLERHVQKWKKDEIKQDYKYYPDFIDWIPKYNAFCNVPENDPLKYEREHHNCYNIFEPLKHELAEYKTPNNISNTINFLKHIFGGSASAETDITGDVFTVGLDYLTLLYQRPTQILPVPCLVSKENSTGKSTFLKWLRLIWGENATVVGNAEFAMSFNSHYITKFIIGIDEGFIEVEKKAEKERIKKLATDDRQFLQYKNRDVQEIDFFSKIIICSNDEKRIMKIDEGEIRWFIIRVPVIPADKKDPNLLERLKNEIPAFLAFLKQRTVHHKNEDRAWFHPKYIVTEQLKTVISETKDYNERAVDTVIRDRFMEYGVVSFTADIKTIQKEINDTGKYKVETTQIREYLKEKKGLNPSKSAMKSAFPNGYTEGINGEDVINYLRRTCKAYTFNIADWLKPEEIKELEIVNESETPIADVFKSAKTSKKESDLPF